MVWFYIQNGQDESNETLPILPRSIEENGGCLNECALATAVVPSCHLMFQDL